MAADFSYLIRIDGLEELLGDITQLTDRQAKTIAQALNNTIQEARHIADRRIRADIAFPPGYLVQGNKGGKLAIRKTATPNDLQAAILAEFRPTSLARFSSQKNPGLARRAGGVSVSVKPGSVKFMKKAFLVKLRRGSALTETAHNLGLAIRLKPGENVKNKKATPASKSNPKWKGVFLLYGPSVDQTFRKVAEQMGPEVKAFLEREYLRLMEE